MSETPTYAELQKQIQALQTQADAIKRQEHADAVQRVKAIMAEYGLTLKDLGAGAVSPRRVVVAPKYRNPATGDTWTGRGKPPRWLQAEIDRGVPREQFLIERP